MRLSIDSVDSIEDILRRHDCDSMRKYSVKGFASDRRKETEGSLEILNGIHSELLRSRRDASGSALARVEATASILANRVFLMPIS